MKTKVPPPSAPAEPSEAEIRDYAYHLYEQSGHQAGHDLDNWLEAAACLKANIPRHRSHTRLHRHIQPPELQAGELCAVSPEAKNLSS
ncbi:MAG TPA: DUF2934 domain-containing protein [Opitutaceae bacterium]|nr:DUF2934 domain-containing protein [Opitutaceae bacterium]